MHLLVHSDSMMSSAMQELLGQLGDEESFLYKMQIVYTCRTASYDDQEFLSWLNGTLNTTFYFA
jgi:hypothetical protein